MGIYLVKSTGKFRYEFSLYSKRYTGAGFSTKVEARRKMAAHKKEVEREQARQEIVRQRAPNDMPFLDLLNDWLDYIKCRRTPEHYKECWYSANRWNKRWPGVSCAEVSSEMIEELSNERRTVSPNAANKEIKYLRAVFNFGCHKGKIDLNPTRGLEFFSVEENRKRVPSQSEISKVIAAASPETRQYLWTLRETIARVGEINRLLWQDVDLERRTITLYTRKSAGGNKVGREVQMTEKLYEILSERWAKRDKSKPWVFYGLRWDKAQGKMIEHPYSKRQGLMKELCKRAGVEPFGFHALRHAGASLLDSCGVPIGVTQKILGHANRSTTEIYLHSIGKSEKSAMEVYEAARQRSENDEQIDPKVDKKVILKVV